MSVATARELLDEADDAIRASPNVELWRPWVARVDAEDILRKVLGREIADIDLDQPLAPADARRFRRLLQRRLTGEPIALIRGEIDFDGLRLRLRPGVFTPRNSSELLAAQAVTRLRGRRHPVAVDVACGAGAVALAIANRVPRATVLGLDIGPAAARLGRENARRLGLGNVSFAAGDLLAPMPRRHAGEVDVFTIHPPYVARLLVPTLAPEIRDFEPPESLTDRSVDGLGLVRRLAAEAPEWLRPGGWVLVEVSPDLARSVRTILGRAGFSDLKSHRDSVGATRVVAGRLDRAGRR